MSGVETEAGIGPVAVDALAEQLIPELLRYFVRRLDDSEDAADAVSETLVVIWRRRRHLPSGEDPARAWAYGVARKVLANARRGRLRRDAAAEHLRERLAEEVVDAHPDLDLRRALDALRADDRELVLLVAWEGFGVAEAGAVLGLKPEAARARYSRARARLRETLRASV
ncbi:RNA polymerase sigma factor [Schumannella sp. 10F1B-5-1]|uniref:RNA polymerase sigma factor n=1 Tax=Schumannella sp. 10F1B-5-1 TaxID=2590780 RepID=UPI001130C079|nr:sigma-70 family RNA polymerase sigma factor [Schumannella sp. 10F1B-5-1]TPW76720.1 sigma-70 family RNA polymerase sigma factor [Schumannella sp. 10F1B-5-1]